MGFNSVFQGLKVKLMVMKNIPPCWQLHLAEGIFLTDRRGRGASGNLKVIPAAT
jgi:hypothetical protein